MNFSFSSLLSMVTDPLFLAGIVVVAGYFAARYWLGRSSLARFLIQFLVFVILTGLLLAGGVAPYRPSVPLRPQAKRPFLGPLPLICCFVPASPPSGLSPPFLLPPPHPPPSK